MSFFGNMMSQRLISLFFLLFLVGCGARSDLAPVAELSAFAKNKKIHKVSHGETLYAIAFHYETDYRQLAQLNHLRPPYLLKVGQIVYLQAPLKKLKSLRHLPSAKPIMPPLRAQPLPVFRTDQTFFYWPSNGRVITTYMPTQGKKGIDIASKQGGKIYAAAAGIVAYAGNGLSGYGNLILIKHSNEYLTAYGNNAKNLVVENQVVKAGQVIAESGIVDHKYRGVHFEIRKTGRPVNPINYLKFRVRQTG